MGVFIVKMRPLHLTGKQGIMARARWPPLRTFSYNRLIHEQSCLLGIILDWVPAFLILALLGIGSPPRGRVYRGDGRNLDFLLNDSISIIARQICHYCKYNTQVS